MRRLSRGLVAYGVFGLFVTAIGVGALVWVDGRVTDLRRDVAATLAQRATTLHLAAVVLRGASTTAGGFAVTVDQTSRAVATAAESITEAQSDLAALEAQLRSVNILGATPLSSSADAVGRLATSIDGLDTRLSLVTDALTGNRQALLGNASSLGQLAGVTEGLAGQVGSGGIEDSLGDLQRLISVTLLVLAAWSAVPAAGALVLGAWLRRELVSRA
jgi:hypothetical protein